MALRSGEYAVRTARRVVVWPKADHNGDGPEVWTNVYDNDGRQVDRVRAKDSRGRLVFDYKAPEGFANRPGYDHQDNYVQVTDRGEIARASDGQAICIKPGTALVYNADGTTTLLTEEWEQWVFEHSHDSVNGDESDVDTEDTSEVDAEVEALEARLALLRGES